MSPTIGGGSGAGGGGGAASGVDTGVVDPSGVGTRASTVPPKKNSPVYVPAYSWLIPPLARTVPDPVKEVAGAPESQTQLKPPSTDRNEPPPPPSNGSEADWFCGWAGAPFCEIVPWVRYWPNAGTSLARLTSNPLMA